MMPPSSTLPPFTGICASVSYYCLEIDRKKRGEGFMPVVLL